MKKRNLYLFLTSLLLAPAVFFILPHQTGQTQEPESPAAIFTVTNNLNTGAGSFRQAIIDANTAAGLDTIRFQIGTGPVEINHNTALPDITQPVIIDGTTQPGFSGTPLITVAGNFSGSLRITGGGSTVKAITLTRFSNGIVLENGGGNILTGNYIGNCPPPTLGCSNSANGVRIINSPNNRIGGATAADRNIINGNEDKGIEITGNASTGNIVTGNYIGRNADGSAGGNGNFGVAIIGAPNNRVGGSAAGERNVIFGNAQLCNLPPLASNSNVFISGAGASGNTVEGNYIGTTIDGTSGGDACAGVRIENAANNTIGGTAGTTPGGACTGACNLISGFAALGNESGVMITGAGAMGNWLVGNFIGTDAAGTARINNDVGVTITSGASNNTVGGTTAAGRNLINNGIWLSAGAAMNTLQGNYIGTDTTGNTGIGFISGGQVSAALTIENAPNNLIGTATGTTLGGACTGGCNLISGNNQDGVQIKGSGSTGNRVDYNYIGLNAAGTGALRNLGGAIRLLNGANNNTIGRPLGYSYQSTTPAPPTTFLIQDDQTGNFLQYDTSSRVYTLKNCRGVIINTGTVPPENVVQNGTTIRISVDQLAYGMRASFDTVTATGYGVVYRPRDGFDQPPPPVIINDKTISNHVGDCPTVGMQTIVGTVTNAANNNKFNFVSLGWSANRLVNLSSSTADGNVLDLSGNSSVYSNLDIATNGESFPAITIANGTGNLTTGLNWTGIGPGSMANYVIDLNDDQIRNPNDPGDTDGGANNTQNHPSIFVIRGLDQITVGASLVSEPNSRYRIQLYNTETVRSVVGGPDYTATIPINVELEIMTNAMGEGSINQVYTGVDYFKFILSEDITATATKIPTPLSDSLVGVNGDTSEFMPPVRMPQPRFDRDNDGKTDFIVYRPGASANAFSFWYVLKSSDFTFQAVQFGNGEDLPVVGDWQGDDVMDLAVWRPSSATWYYSRITGNPTTSYESIPWGSPTDRPVVGDFDGDGANDAAIFRPANGTWWIRNSLGGGTFVQSWGLGSDKLVPADYDGDGDTDIAVYRNGTWYISICPTCPVRYEQFGLASDVPVPGDYDGDGRADIAVWRPSDGIWYILQSTAGFTANRFGLPTDKALNGDFDADGKNDLAVWRPSDGIFYVLRSEQGFAAVRWGLSTDVPVSMFPNQ